MNNLFREIPSSFPKEIVETLCQSKNVRVERIVSQGHSTPGKDWYDQPENEWVAVLQGHARLEYEDGTVMEMRPGDFVHLPAHCKHRVDWTTREEPTIWLAIFYPVD